MLVLGENKVDLMADPDFEIFNTEKFMGGF